MRKLRLTVVMPIFNEASHLPRTIEGLVAALDGSGFEPELVLVDDGSTDGGAEVARRSAGGRVAVRVLSQPNRGRFEARRAGLAAARGEYVLFLDARVRLAPDALRFVHERLDTERVWNGHVAIETENVLGAFWRLLAELAWRDYFDYPRTTSFGLREFDRFPKGTTCFLAPRDVLASAFEHFRPRYADIRLANDDTPILRALAANERIAISPFFACVYSPRTRLSSFFRHSFRRGTVFVDGHGTPASRFFPLVVGFFPVSAALAYALLRRPLLAPVAVAVSGIAAGAYGARAGRSRRDVATLTFVTPLYGIAHGAGMWRGLALMVRDRLRDGGLAA
jgi:glycosyltransferase involved in cell wall biosynthesis